MRHIVVDTSNTVVNTIEAPEGFTLDGLDVIPHETGAIGDTYVDGVLTRPVVAVTADGVIAERTRRLALGFDYDFGDARGIHHFETSEEDMKGWDTVDKSANAFVAVGMPDQEINLATGSGAVTITAIEWSSIMVAATIWQQPIWQASFTLQAMDPIPQDYTDDKWWT